MGIYLQKGPSVLYRRTCSAPMFIELGKPPYATQDASVNKQYRDEGALWNR